MSKQKNEKWKASESVKADIALKEYWQNNERFADLFNHVLFGGHDYLKPDKLCEKDTDQSAVIKGKMAHFNPLKGIGTLSKHMAMAQNLSSSASKTKAT